MVTYQVAYGDEETGIMFYGNDSYQVFIDNEPISYADSYEEACKIFETAYEQMFYTEELRNALDELK